MFEKTNNFISKLKNRVFIKLQYFFSPERILVISFFLFILAGTILLMLPQSTKGTPLHFVDAFFTATSATCVTGLVVVDTGTTFTLFGQLVILVMIQCGGLGIMSFSTALLYVLEGRFSVGSRDVLFETLSQGPVSNIKDLLKSVFISTMVIEAVGFVILTWRFWSDMPFPKAAYYGLFHSISAFCNAGFSLFPDSFVRYQGDFVINFTLIFLIIIGGIGFIIIHEMHKERKLNFQNISFHSYLVLLVTAVLIIGGAILFFTLEYSNSIKDMPLHTKVLVSLFQSVTTRTAGFNTIDIGMSTNPVLFILILFMFIGGAPGSCAGGIKVTTFAVLLSFIKTRAKNEDEVNLFNRRIPADTVSRVVSIVFFAMISVVICTLILLITELAGLSHSDSRGLSLELLFEIVSALGTVGLSVGITPDLSIAGRLLVTMVMFAGRLGPLTIALTIGRREKVRYKYAQEKVLVG